MMAEGGDVILYGFLIAKRQASEGVFEGLFVVAVEAQIEVIGGIDADDGVFQQVQLAEFGMFAGPLVEFLDWSRW